MTDRLLRHRQPVPTPSIDKVENTARSGYLRRLPQPGHRPLGGLEWYRRRKLQTRWRT